MARKRFRPATNIKWAKLLDAQPPFIQRKRSRGKYAVGIRYERKVQEELGLLALGMEGLRYLESPWIEFEDESGRRWCQADGILLDRRQQAALIYEIKYRHCLEAWWQLTWLYEPVVRVLFPDYPITARMEICHWHDPAVAFPQGYDLTESPLQLPKRSRVAVCIFNPGRKRRVPTPGPSSSEGDGQISGSDGPAPVTQGPAGVV